MPHTVLSLFENTGTWLYPYEQAGYDTAALDIKHGTDISKINIEWLYENLFCCYDKFDIVLAAPPCTDFTISGAQYWQQKDASGQTDKSVELVYQVIRIIDVCQPKIWALENPVGRISKLIPELGHPWYFQPWWFGDPYTKKTGLWGEFNKNLQRNTVKPITCCKQGSWLMQLGGKSEATKDKHSATPKGFARAFFEANDLYNKSCSFFNNNQSSISDFAPVGAEI